MLMLNKSYYEIDDDTSNSNVIKKGQNTNISNSQNIKVNKNNLIETNNLTDNLQQNVNSKIKIE